VEIKNDILMRLFIVYAILLMLALLILGRVFYLQVWEKDIWMKEARNYQQKDIKLFANRGDICSEDGRVLASSLPYYRILMDTKSEALTDDLFNSKIDSMCAAFSNLFRDRTKEQYKKDIKQARALGNRAYELKKDVGYLQFKKIKLFPLVRMGRFKSGVYEVPYSMREHPYGDLALRTVGRLKYEGENYSVIGLEATYENELKGVNGIRLRNKNQNYVNDDNEIEPKDGSDLITTINIDYQDVAEQALKKALVKYEAHHGCVVLMEVSTGEVKAISNLHRSSDGTYSEMYNYAIAEGTEPGSTFKLASIIAAIEDGYVEPEDNVDTQNGTLKIGNFVIRDANESGYGIISVKKAFELSSNVGIASLIMKYYQKNPKQFVDRLVSMSLNERLNTDIKGEGDPIIRYPGEPLWSFVTLPQMSIGYEVHQAPIQTLTLYNAVANNGKMIKPRFVKYLKYHGKTTRRFNTEVINSSICSQSTLKKVQKMLEGVVENGTASSIKSDVYSIAGKTGTAKIFDDVSKQYIKQYKASFVGYFPANKPKYSCLVMIYNPVGDVYYGAMVAAPVFKEISDRVFVSDHNLHVEINPAGTKSKLIPRSKDGYSKDIFNICNRLSIPIVATTQNGWVSTKKGNSGLVVNAKAVKQGTMPQVIGMGIRDAVFILENMGLKVKVLGKGSVVRQSLQAGSEIRKGETIVIELG